MSSGSCWPNAICWMRADVLFDVGVFRRVGRAAGAWPPGYPRQLSAMGESSWGHGETTGELGKSFCY